MLIWPHTELTDVRKPHTSFGFQKWTTTRTEEIRQGFFLSAVWSCYCEIIWIRWAKRGFLLVTNHKPDCHQQERELNSSIQENLKLSLPTWLAESIFQLTDSRYFPDLEKAYTVIPSKACTVIIRNRTGNYRDTVKHDQHSHSFYSPNTQWGLDKPSKKTKKE